MILRRPYAFLIKHFRIIHLVLFVLFGYMAYMANNILSFFKEYIKYNGNIDVIASEYISYFIFVSVVLIIVISSVIFLLMKYKKKPKLFYIILVVVSGISLILFLYLYGNIRTLEANIMSGKNIRLLRDISRFNFLILFITSIPVLVRGLGFDIKKFNFNSDLQELNLEAKDSEEVEVNIDLSSEKLKRTGRRTFRELKYYYLENRLIINIIIGFVGVLFIMIFPFNRFVINRNLNEGEIFSTNNFNIKINESFISDRNRISRNNSYVILKVSVKGNVKKYRMDMDELVLSVGDKKYIPSMKYYYYFDDVGRGYRENILSTNEYEDYVLIYNIDNVNDKDKLSFNYVKSNRNIKLSPEILD